MTSFHVISWSCAVRVHLLLGFVCHLSYAVIDLGVNGQPYGWCHDVARQLIINHLSYGYNELNSVCTATGHSYMFDEDEANRLGTLIYKDTVSSCLDMRPYTVYMTPKHYSEYCIGALRFWKEHPFIKKQCEKCIPLSDSANLPDFLWDICGTVPIPYKLNGLQSRYSAKLKSEVQSVCTDDVMNAPNAPLFCLLKPLYDVGLFTKLASRDHLYRGQDQSGQSSYGSLAMNYILRPTCILAKRDMQSITGDSSTWRDYKVPFEQQAAIADLILQNVQNLNLNFFNTYLPPKEKVDDYIANECGSTDHYWDNEEKSMCLLLKVIQQAYLYIQTHQYDSNPTSIDGKRRLILNKDIDKSYFQNLQLSKILTAISNTKASLVNIANDIKNHISNQFSHLKVYFTTVETFNSKIAKADVGFITSRLSLYNETLSSSYKTMTDDFGELLHLTLVGSGVQVAERAALLTMEIASAANPLEFLTGGTSAVDIYDRTSDLGVAISNLVSVKSIQSALEQVKTSTLSIASKLKKNHDFLETVKNLTETQIQEYEGAAFQTACNEFIRLYNKYNPAVTRPEIQALGAHWEALLAATCDVVANLDTAGSSGVASKINNAGWCTSLPAVLTQINGLHEEIYDFQFDMMDAMASFVRSRVTSNAAKDIKTGFTKLQAVTLDYSNKDSFGKVQLIGALTFMTDKANELKAIHLYCNALEYEAGGQRPSACGGASTNLNDLLLVSTPGCTGKTANLGLYVPTSATLNDNTTYGYINLKDLFEGKSITFKIPDVQWLVNNRWIRKDETSRSLYVSKFQIYLPVETDSNVRITSFAEPSGSQQLHPNSSTVFVMTKPPTFEFEYVIGIPDTLNCLKRPINNPYSTGCSTSKICPLTLSSSRVTSLRPSVYSTWTLSVIGGKHLPIPDPVTRFDLIMGIELCKKDEGRSPVPVHTEDIRPQQNGHCCPTIDYRGFGGSGCIPCPGHSMPSLGGYFCTKN